MSTKLRLLLKCTKTDEADEEEDEEDEEDGSGDASLNGPVEKKQKILS